MLKLYWRVLSSGLALCVLTLLPHFAMSQEPAQAADVRLLIDISGSMKRNDPHNLRQPAIDLLVRLLPDGSKAGIWTFGNQVNMLVPHQVVDDSWRQFAIEKAPEVNSVGLFTNIGAALEQAAHDLAAPSKAFKTSIILLTDGMVDISKDPEQDRQERRRIVESVLPQLKAADYTVHTVALSAQADADLMERLALSTDGTTSVATSADDLTKIFLTALSVAVPSQSVPLIDNSFVVDSSVDEFTALVFRTREEEQTRLLGPDQSVFTQSSPQEQVNWYRTDTYDLITVKQPFEGEWQLQAALDPESRITVVSNLNLRVKSLPSNVFRGASETLSFLLQEDGETVTRSDFLSLLDNELTMTHSVDETPGARVWSHAFPAQSPPANGIYTVSLPEFGELGEYEIHLELDGKTFKRQFIHRIAVREPFTAVLEQILDDNGQPQNVLTVRSHSDKISAQNTQIVASIVNPQRRRLVKPLGLTESDQWQTVIHTDQPGDYEITVQVTGKDSVGESYDYQLKPVTLSNQPDQAFVEAAEPVEEDAVTPEPDEASTVVDVPEEPVVTELDQQEEATRALPTSVFYALLGVGNLVLLGGGFLLFRKLTADDEEGTAPVIGEEPEPEPNSEPDLDAMMSMDDDSNDEEEPPMEDLDPGESDDAPGMALDMDFDAEDDLLDDTGTSGSVPISDDISEEDVDADHWGDTLVERVAGDAMGEETERVAAERAKAQGLDLAEEELDDAITNLIDELDDEGESDDEDDYDDFGLGDEDGMRKP